MTTDLILTSRSHPALPPSSSTNNAPSSTTSSKLPTLRKGTTHAHAANPTDSAAGAQETSAREEHLLALGLPRLVHLGTSHPPPDASAKKPQHQFKGKKVVHTFVPHEQREMNPQPMPFHARMFNASPLTKVSVVGQSLPSVHGKESPAASVAPSDQSASSSRGKPNRDKSSTIIKKFSVPRRHETSWGGNDSVQRQTRGFIFHSERYQWDDMAHTPDSAADSMTSQEERPMALMVQLRGKGLMDPNNNNQQPQQQQQQQHQHHHQQQQHHNNHNTSTLPAAAPSTQQQSDLSMLSQRDRVQAELEFLERMRGLRRRGQLVAHREPQGLLLGGSKVAMCERMDIMGEIARLRTMSHCLPTKAKDLYVGRGFKLPPSHKLNRGIPRSRVHYAPNKKFDPPVPRGSAASAPQMGASQSPPIGPQATVLLKGENVVRVVDDGERFNTLRQTYQRLHQACVQEGSPSLAFKQLELPADITRAQKDFLSKVYDITAANGRIEEDEFISLTLLSERIAQTQGDVKASFDTIEESSFQESLMQYLESFEVYDKDHHGKLSMSSLLNLLSALLPHTDNMEDHLHNVTKPLRKDDTANSPGDVDKLQYIAHVPYFLHQGGKEWAVTK